MKLPLWATVFMVFGVVVLLSLGGWQLQRLAWKQDLLAQYRAVYGVDAGAQPLSRADLNAPDVFARGYLVGTYHHDQELILQARTYKGQVGYHVITPLVLSEGGAVFVNRGWVPVSFYKDGNFARPQGVVRVAGLLRGPQRYNMFVPDNQPDQDMWYRLDVAQMAAHLALSDVYDVALFAEHEAEKGGEMRSGSYPVGHMDAALPRNNHMQYALFWFAMAGVLVLIYLLRFFLRR